MEQVGILWVLVAALAGVIAGGGTVSVVLARANRSKELKDTTEQLLADAVPQAALDQFSALMNRVIDVVERRGAEAQRIITEGATFLRDVTDGQPNEVPPQEVNIGGAAH